MTQIDPAELMRAAIAKAREGIAAGQSPFGCAIALEGRIIATAHNVVWATTDITAHAEMAALREACRELGRIDLSGAVVATTCEPCPMCFSALHWARVETVYFGADIADATAAGFNELFIPAAELARLSRSPVCVVPGMLSDECRKLFDEFRASPGARLY